MPALSLVVCVYHQRDLLERLMQRAEGCYDELVVIHDGPEHEPSDNPLQGDDLTKGKLPSHAIPQLAVDFADPDRLAEAARFWKEKTGSAVKGSVHELVQTHGGRFFEGPRCFNHECQWPFAWSQCANDWILLLDSDEFPGPELKAWLKQFRAGPGSDSASGYTCVWPLWDGQKTLSQKYPRGRLFLIHRQRVRYFAMGESRPRPDAAFQDLDLILHHQPSRRSYGLRNVFRKDGARWRRRIAEALLKRPTDLSCWRWNSDRWPQEWEQIRQRPLHTAIKRLGLETLRGLREQWRTGKRLFPMAAVSGPLYHALICLEFRRQRRIFVSQNSDRNGNET